jgi:hypothetical protein
MVNEIVTPAINVKNFKGWNTVTEYHSTIQAGASSEIKARNEVNLHNEFHAEQGSETHIYCEAVFTHCPIETNNFQKVINATSNSSTKMTDFKRRNVELSFAPKTKFTFVDVKPNPNNGSFIIELRSNEISSDELEIKVFDLTGKIVLHAFSQTAITAIELKNMPVGLYNLQIQAASKILNHKIIIN